MRISRVPREEITFAELPNTRAGRPQAWGPALDAVQENPGEWALVATQAKHNVRRRLNNMPGFQAALRNAPRGATEGDLWLRYVGENGEYA